MADPEPPPEELDQNQGESDEVPAGQTSTGERPVPEPELAGLRERDRELRERVLDIEAALAAIGASGLPQSPRYPNRFQSALDAPRLRTEYEAAQAERQAIAERIAKIRSSPR